MPMTLNGHTTFMLEHDLAYANLGLYMSCYSYTPHAAQWMYEELTRNQLWVNCGPYAMCEKLYKNYAEHFLSKRDYNGQEYQFLMPYRNHELLGFGKTPKEMFDIYNFERPESAPYFKNSKHTMLALEVGHHTESQELPKVTLSTLHVS